MGKAPSMPAHTMSTRADLKRLLLGQQAVDAGNADVGNQFSGIAHQAGRDGSFFCDGQIAGSGADDGR